MGAATRTNILNAASLLIPHDRIAAAQLTDILRAHDALQVSLDSAYRHFQAIGATAARTDKKMADLNEGIRKAAVLFTDIVSKAGTALDVYLSMESFGVYSVGKKILLSLAQDAFSTAFFDYLGWNRWTLVPPREEASIFNDIVIGNPKGGSMSLLSGNDMFIGNSSFAYEVTGGAGNDKIIGGSSKADVLLGDEGNDILIDRNGVTAAAGGSGNDWIEVGGARNVAYGGTGNDTLIGGAGTDQLYGVDAASKPKTILASSPLDRKFIIGAGGSDTIFGGMGADIIAGDGPGDSADGSALLAPLRAAIADKAPLVNGAAGNDSLTGYAGNDIISGGAGNDIIFGDDAGLNATSTVITGIGNDSLFGDLGNDRIQAGWGNDSIYGGGGDDLLYDSFVFTGATLPTGKLDNDRLMGGDGNDQIFLNQGQDTVDGGAGSDKVSYIGSKGVGLVFTDDAAAATPLVRGYDSFNLARGTVVEGTPYDSLRNVEHIAGTSQSDLYIFSTAGVNISDPKGDDRYVLKTADLTKLTGMDNWIFVTDADGEFSIQFDQTAIPGVMLWGPHPGPPYYHVDMHIENAAGSLTTTVVPSEQLNNPIYDLYLQEFYFPGDSVRQLETYSGSYTEGLKIVITMYYNKVTVKLSDADTWTYFNVTMPASYHDGDMFSLLNSQKVNFNIGTNSLDFDLF